MAPLLRQGLVLFLLCTGVTVALHGSVVTQRETTGIVIEGTVIDSAGGPIPGATIELSQGSKIIATVVTNGHGKYTIQKLNPGTYALKALLAGFRTDQRPLKLIPKPPRLVLAPMTLEVRDLGPML